MSGTYTSIAFLVFLVSAAWPTKMSGPNSALGAFFLAAVWPVILVVFPYLLVKRYVFHRSGFSDQFYEFEITACLLVTAVLLYSFLTLTHQIPNGRI